MTVILRQSAWDIDVVSEPKRHIQLYIYAVMHADSRSFGLTLIVHWTLLDEEAVICSTTLSSLSATTFFCASCSIWGHYSFIYACHVWLLHLFFFFCYLSGYLRVHLSVLVVDKVFFLHALVSCFSWEQHNFSFVLFCIRWEGDAFTLYTDSDNCVFTTFCS